ncbi:leukocyte elastase inhibitor-like [Planococcus citri]|uniref:leukocyte elastase inhibitor-like n=1 Tax=Planococcus citri TaxID=170843 RepID=UPI0031F9D948
MSDQRETEITSVSQDEISNASMEFACSVIRSLLQNNLDGNVIFSPISIYSALALVYFGSTGNTRSEIAQVMSLPAQQIESQELFEILSEMLLAIRVAMGTTNRAERVIDIQNHIFIQSDINLIASYVSHIESLDGCEIVNVNFEDDSKNATHMINDCVSHDTNGDISQCLTESLDYSARIVLASCLNLKLIWEDGFHHQSTRSAKFHTRRGDVDVQMMLYQTRDKLPYADLPDLHLEALELPFKQKQESVYIILPKLENTLDDVISSLDHSILQKIIDQVVPSYVNLNLPKLNLTCTGNLFEALQILGMNEAFTDQAQLNNMTTDPLLRISKIVHAVKVEFEEEKEGTFKKIFKFYGTCSCCWRNSESRRTRSNGPSDAINSPTNPIRFDVNRPFLFFIYHRVTKSILFLGVIRNPNTAE